MLIQSKRDRERKWEMISRQICVKSCRCWTQSSLSCLDTVCWWFGIKVASFKINPTTQSQLSNLNIKMRMSLHPGFNLETVSVVLVFLALTSSFDPCSDIKAPRYFQALVFMCGFICADPPSIFGIYFIPKLHQAVHLFFFSCQPTGVAKTSSPYAVDAESFRLMLQHFVIILCRMTLKGDRNRWREPHTLIENTKSCKALTTSRNNAFKRNVSIKIQHTLFKEAFWNASLSDLVQNKHFLCSAVISVFLFISLCWAELWSLRCVFALKLIKALTVWYKKNPPKTIQD